MPTEATPDPDPVLSGVIDSQEVFMIPGWEGYYAITRDGMVWSENRAIRDRNGHMKRIGGRWMKECDVDWPSGVPGFALRRDGQLWYQAKRTLLRATFGA